MLQTLLELFKQLSPSLRGSTWCSQLTNRLFSVFPLPTRSVDFIAALDQFLQPMVDGKMLVDDVPCTLDLLHQVIVACIIKESTPTNRLIISILRKPDWKIKPEGLHSIVLKQDLQLFRLVYKNTDKKKVDELYQYVFDNSPAILALMLSENALKPKRFFIDATNLNKTQITSLEILLTHPNTEASIRDDPILKSYLEA